MASGLASMFEPQADGTSGAARAAGFVGTPSSASPSKSEKTRLLEPKVQQQQQHHHHHQEQQQPQQQQQQQQQQQRYNSDAGYSGLKEPRELRELVRQETLSSSHATAESVAEDLESGSSRRRASSRFGVGWLLLNDTYIPELWEEEDMAGTDNDEAAEDIVSLTRFQRVMRQLTMQVVPGVLAFMVMAVVVIAFGSAVCAHPRLRPYIGFAVQMGALGTALHNLVFTSSKIPYNGVSHDLFVVPFFASFGADLADHIEDDDELARTFFVTIMLSVTGFGVLIFLAGGSPFLRIAEFTPMPVVSGLVAGVGIGIIQAAINTQTAGSFTVWDVLFCALAIACSASMIMLERMGYPTANTFVPVYAGVTLTFYIMLALGGAPAWAWADKHAFFAREMVDKRAWTVWTSGFLFEGPIRWDGVASSFQQIFSYMILNLLRQTLQYQATLKVVKMRGDDKHELRVMGVAHMIGGVLGSFGAINNLGVTATCMGFGGTHPKAPGAMTGVLTLLFFFIGFGPLAIVPKFVFAAILANTGVVLIMSNLIKPCQTLPRGEAIILCVIVFISVTGGKMMAVSAGAVASVMLFVYNWYHAGCIKYEASGLTWHSSVERTELSVEWLEEHGDRIQIVQLQGYLFFGNATQARERVREILEDQAPSALTSTNRNEDQDPVEYVILDLTLVIGLDANALTALDDTAGLCGRTNGVELIISGAQEELGNRLKEPSSGDSLSRVRHFDDLDEALSYCEDRMLSRVGHERYATDTVTSAPTSGGMTRVQSARPEIWIHGRTSPMPPSAMASAPPPTADDEEPRHGFKRWLKMASSRYSFSTDRLLPLAAHTKPLTLQKGQV